MQDLFSKRLKINEGSRGATAPLSFSAIRLRLAKFLL